MNSLRRAAFGFFFVALAAGVSAGASAAWAAGADGADAKVRPVIPDAVVEHYNHAIALYAKKDVDGAIAEYREAIRLKPDFADAHFNLALVLADEKEDYDSSLAEFREAARLNPNMPYVQTALRRVREMKAEAEAAAATAKRLRDEAAARARVQQVTLGALAGAFALLGLPLILMRRRFHGSPEAPVSRGRAAAGKMLAGVFLLFGGGAVFVMQAHGYLLVSGLSAEPKLNLALLALILCVSTAGGAAIWGWRRWRMSVGFLALVAGGLELTYVAVCSFTSAAPTLYFIPWAGDRTRWLSFFGTEGGVLLGVAVLLINRQKQLDSAASELPAIPAATPPALPSAIEKREGGGITP